MMRPPLDAVEAATLAIKDGNENSRTPGAVAWAALGDAYPAMKRHVIEGLLEELETEIRHRADILSDEFDRDTAYALAEDLGELGLIRTWLQKRLGEEEQA